MFRLNNISKQQKKIHPQNREKPLSVTLSKARIAAGLKSTQPLL
jgi:hypothetical protein